MQISKESKIIFFYYIFIFLYWAILYFQGIKEQPTNYYYQVVEGFIPLIGGLLGIIKAKKWGFLSSKVGSALFFISLGTFSWGVGQMLWSIYYNLIQKVDIPYPSFADVGFIMAIPCWVIGSVFLSKATGAHLSLKHLRGKILLFIIPLIVLVVSYYLLLIVARGGSIPLGEDRLKLVFDLAYPIGDIVILTFTLVIYGLSFNYLGGKYKFPIICILAGWVLMYFSDFSFSYTTTIGTYYDGHWVDIMFPTVMTLLTFGVNSIDPDLIKSGENKLK
jgi:hypothetical protein